MPVLPQRLAYPVVIAAAMILVGAVVYHNIEGWSWVDSFYFASSTLTTVGFGDLHPTHATSKIFTIFYIIAGVSIVFYAINLLGAYTVEEQVYSKPLDAIKHRITNSKPKTSKEHNLAREIESLYGDLHKKIRQLESEQRRKK